MSTPSLVAWGAVLRATGASPAPAEVVETPPEELVTPGTIGFLVTFGVAVALVLLVLDMVRRNRRIDVRAARRDEELRARAEAEEAGEAAHDLGAVRRDGTHGAAGGPADDRADGAGDGPGRGTAGGGADRPGGPRRPTG